MSGGWQFKDDVPSDALLDARARRSANKYMLTQSDYNETPPWLSNTPSKIKPKIKRRSTMKTQKELSNIVAMLSDDVVSVECTFHTHGSGKTYTYKAERSLGLKAGDVVVVTKNHGATTQSLPVVTVVSVNSECVLDNPESVDYQWVVQVVDFTRLQEIIEWEESAGKALYVAQRKQHRQSMFKALGVVDENLMSSASLSLPVPVTDDAEVLEDTPSPFENAANKLPK